MTDVLRVAAFGTLGSTALLSLAFVGLDGATLAGVEIPTGVAIALVLVPALVGLVAVVRKSALFTGVASALFVVPALVEGVWTLTLLGGALALAWAVSLLAFAEVSHMGARRGTLEGAMAPEAVSNLDRAMREYVRTLGVVLALAALVATGAVALLALMSFAGPAQWRASYEIASPAGVALVALALLVVAALAALARGADFTWREREARPLVPDEPAKTSDSPMPTQEVDLDALE